MHNFPPPPFKPFFRPYIVFHIRDWINSRKKKDDPRIVRRERNTQTPFPRFPDSPRRRRKRGRGGERFFEGWFNFIRCPPHPWRQGTAKIVSNWPVAESSVPPLPPRTKSGSVIPAGWTVEILPGGGYQPRPTGMASIPCRQLTPD